MELGEICKRWRQFLVERVNAPARPENVNNVGGNTVSPKEKTLPKFAVGSEVRVKKGVTASNVPLGGCCGTVYEVSGTVCLVHWNEATLQAIPSSRREQWQRDGVDFQVMWLQEVALEADPREPLCIEQPKEELRSAG